MEINLGQDFVTRLRTWRLRLCTPFIAGSAHPLKLTSNHIL